MVFQVSGWACALSMAVAFAASGAGRPAVASLAGR